MILIFSYSYLYEHDPLQKKSNRRLITRLDRPNGRVNPVNAINGVNPVDDPSEPSLHFPNLTNLLHYIQYLDSTTIRFLSDYMLLSLSSEPTLDIP